MTFPVCCCSGELNEQQSECTSQCNYGFKWEKSVIAKECQTHHIVPISKWFWNPHNSNMPISQESARWSEWNYERAEYITALTEANLYATINTQIGTKPHNYLQFMCPSEGKCIDHFLFFTLHIDGINCSGNLQGGDYYCLSLDLVNTNESFSTHDAMTFFSCVIQNKIRWRVSFCSWTSTLGTSRWQAGWVSTSGTRAVGTTGGLPSHQSVQTQWRTRSYRSTLTRRWRISPVVSSRRARDMNS